MVDDNTKLFEIAKGATEVIFRVEQAFPFNIFPDSISVDKNKIDIVYRHFLWQKDVFTILLRDLTTIKIHIGPIYATVLFEVRGYEKNPEPVTHILKEDAVKLREIVIGLTRIAGEVNLKKINEKRFRAIRKIGNAQEKLMTAVQ